MSSVQNKSNKPAGLFQVKLSVLMSHLIKDYVSFGHFKEASLITLKDTTLYCGILASKVSGNIPEEISRAGDIRPALGF